MNKKVKIGLIIFFIGYFALFSVRMYYLSNRIVFEESIGNHFEDSSMVNTVNKSILNIASDRISIISKDSYGPDKVVTIDQKYEKIANISANTNDFEKDNTNMRKVIKEDNAVIQFENSRGVKGKRVVDLTIGIHPDKFDIFVDKLKAIGIATDFNIQKIDKTSEYMNLNARRAALEKTIESLKSLKNNGGSIAELISLENKIFEIEESLQNYGVQLGDFNGENELCTVKLSLSEKGADNTNITTLKNTLNSLLWSAGYYILIIICIMFTIAVMYMGLLLINKFKGVYINIFKSK